MLSASQVPAPSAAYDAYDSVYEEVEEEELEEEARNIQKLRDFDRCRTLTQKTRENLEIGLCSNWETGIFPCSMGRCI